MNRGKNRKDGHWPVVMEQVPAANARGRLRRAFDLILRVAAKVEMPSADSVGSKEEADDEKDG